MKEKIIEAAKNICIMFVSTNIVISSIFATITIQSFLWGIKKN